MKMFKVKELMVVIQSNDAGTTTLPNAFVPGACSNGFGIVTEDTLMKCTLPSKTRVVERGYMECPAASKQEPPEVCVSPSNSPDVEDTQFSPADATSLLELKKAIATLQRNSFSTAPIAKL